MRQLGSWWLNTSLAGLLFLGACSQSVTEDVPFTSQQLVDAGPTSRIQQPPVLAPQLGTGVNLGEDLLNDSVVLDDLNAVFASAQSVDPLNILQPRSEIQQLTSAAVGKDGYTVTFYDFYGNAFAYVNNISQGTTSTNASYLASRHKPDAVPPEDESTWVDATYVTGTNTRRTPISTYMHGFPVLYGMYSQASIDAGFSRGNVQRYIMPSDSHFWALMNDGRYFDLLNISFLSANDVAEAKAQYDDLLDRAANDSEFAAYATTNWQTANNAYELDPSGCPDKESNCIDDPNPQSLEPQWIKEYEKCETRRFLWKTWKVCSDDGWVGGLNSISSQAAKYDYQFVYEGRANGCGPSSGASLLWWWKVRGGRNTMDGDFNKGWKSSDAAYERAARQLVSDMNSFGSIRFLGFIEIGLRGQQRATWPSNYAPGLNKYLNRRGVPLVAKTTWGWGTTTWSTSLRVLKSNYNKSNPTPVVAFEGSISTQHLGMTKGFDKDPFGGLHAKLLAPLRGKSSLNLSAWWTLAGVYWLEPK